LAFKYTKTYPKKSLGQNYLIDENIASKIVSSFKINKDDLVLEIGPGKGEITKHILSFTNNVIAVEIDKNNFAYLSENYPGLNVINEDFLDVDLNDIKNKLKGSANDKLRIIGNIPYNISSEILFMMQEELAKRIVAIPSTKDYSRLSIMAQVFCTPELLFKVSRSCFYPKPKVDSRIIYFDFMKNHVNEIADIGFFRNFVKTAYMSRRKMLRYTMHIYNIDIKSVPFDFDFTRRIESLSINEIIKLSNNLSSIVKS
jgi:16S rRNA (adenine1518-N6/adenine1519-N6)-dimethyltransferase